MASLQPQRLRVHAARFPLVAVAYQGSPLGADHRDNGAPRRGRFAITVIYPWVHEPNFVSLIPQLREPFGSSVSHEKENRQLPLGSLRERLLNPSRGVVVGRVNVVAASPTNG